MSGEVKTNEALQNATSDELIEELSRRCESHGCLFVGIVEENGDTPDSVAKGFATTPAALHRMIEEAREVFEDMESDFS
jgi:hypothetical protein